MSPVLVLLCMYSSDTQLLLSFLYRGNLVSVGSTLKECDDQFHEHLVTSGMFYSVEAYSHR